MDVLVVILAFGLRASVTKFAIGKEVTQAVSTTPNIQYLKIFIINYCLQFNDKVRK